MTDAGWYECLARSFLRKSIQFNVEGSHLAEFMDGLPSAMMGGLVRRYDENSFFRFPIDEIEMARDLRSRATDAGLNVVVTTQLIGEPTDFTDDRIFVLFAPVFADAQLAARQITESVRCGSCGTEYSRLKRGGQRPTLKLDERPEWPVFRPESQKGTVITSEYANELRARNLLAGADLSPLQTRGKATDYYLLASSIDIGMPYVDHPVDCTECGRARGGAPRFYPLYRKPAETADVYYSLRYGEEQPIVSGRLARELDNRLGGHPTIDFFRAGWHPDHDDDARVPI